VQVDERTSALEQLYRDRYTTFRDVLAGVVGSHDLAREVVQEAFARALRERRRFRGEGSLEAWVWKIAVNVARKQRRRLVQERELTSERAADARPSSDSSSVRAAVLALPPRRRLVIFLRYFADRSYREIAEIVGVSEGTVAATLSQAHRELATRLEREGVRR
jgi:RNA polymerase sigma-70 factor (ECF subfamily)